MTTTIIIIFIQNNPFSVISTDIVISRSYIILTSQKQLKEIGNRDSSSSSYVVVVVVVVVVVKLYLNTENHQLIKLN